MHCHVVEELNWNTSSVISLNFFLKKIDNKRGKSEQPSRMPIWTITKAAMSV